MTDVKSTPTISKLEIKTNQERYGDPVVPGILGNGGREYNCRDVVELLLKLKDKVNYYEDDRILFERRGEGYGAKIYVHLKTSPPIRVCEYYRSSGLNHTFVILYFGKWIEHLNVVLASYSDFKHGVTDCSDIKYGVVDDTEWFSE